MQCRVKPAELCPNHQLYFPVQYFSRNRVIHVLIATGVPIQQVFRLVRPIGRFALKSNLFIYLIMTSAETKLFDLSFLEQMDDQAFIIQVVTLYLQDTQADLATMENDFGAGDLDAVYKIAHKLKSSTGMLQANSLFLLLEKTEKTAKAGILTSELSSMLQSVRSEFGILKLALETHLQQFETA